jgi:hypothetical protein
VGTTQKCLVSKSKIHNCFIKAELREKPFKFNNKNDKDDDNQQQQKKKK